ncbi:cobalt ECF transporter T component CbiQ [Dehalogenimonas alkenigignens]|uniref:Cobalt ABC transporter, permease protein CbiQ n=1 Tax=Dehalogenimonas alkenigignens TaxID=1217799 RepID=A0A0W0GHB9_9CHLR|nr:cobalt ECF transporter T component CbiQ [Dehalogenimonas alkenigignens]KTB47945.1 cobalt ABC transporter, permease protein CbiQ [Dehalogenimonas alkenigignens]PVV82479.1 cobalt ECF transporter T component CbiQ [Dehalogenimonas alkenigignens]
MRHSFLDQYSHLVSPAHRRDPRLKFLLSLLFIVAVVLTPAGSWATYAAYFAILGSIFAISKLPLGYVLKRSLIILPFVFLLGVINVFTRPGVELLSFDIGGWHLGATDGGLKFISTLLARSWLSVLALILLTSTTPLPALLKGIERLGAPRVLVMILSFMYRYLFLLIDEVLRMKQARDSRSVGSPPASFQARTVGSMIGSLFIRSYERGERVYAAMAARGFDGQSRTFNELAFDGTDIAAGAALSLVLILPLTVSLLV